ncbi:tetratricopeptide repeat protein [Pseudoroseicyclus sp. CLL3-39]|uniref:Cell division coordinator CpoB n=2 Tax=Pseudoroseicyclus tamaricis TaxID=2705421 RepID=A0A6B2JZX3_9RHOB|nr:tetratricopeptide repeat protein [Pseudoroseicyclus tamaricis]NDV02219.1 tetratricopeptide repeat protein [Pseudoroseicyclus tamaricis]
MRAATLALLAALALPGTAPAQEANAETLADIRQQLSALYVEVDKLRGELNSTGFPQGVSGSTPLDRLNAIEAELQRITAKAEELEFRINRITVDGTNRLGDLEFRLCEIEPGCDIGALGDTPSLGGIDSASEVPVPAPPPAEGPQLAVGEQEAFDAAEAAFAEGRYSEAADLYQQYLTTYPGGPLSNAALYKRGDSLEQTGDMQAAARAYLEAFSGAPNGEFADDALFRLGRSLGRLGQAADACVTLAELPTRFPASPLLADTAALRSEFGCP